MKAFRKPGRYGNEIVGGVIENGKPFRYMTEEEYSDFRKTYSGEKEMTHEAGIEAAVASFEAAETDHESVVEDLVQGIIQAYLSASGMVLVPREPTDEMMKSELDKVVYKAYLAGAPDSFKSKP